MDLKIATFLLVLLAAVTISEGGVFKCCVEISPRISRQLLRTVDKYDIQKKGGACEKEALILHVKGKTFCGSPKLLPIIRRNSRKKRLSHKD
ncbi:hypothetical protein COCON_G00164840 [Conger conger]|uniref:Chemokine interleukin-8-like domain-containing protein n=1 Tax=Conger conger TaxID=82655 RepID=A0A9Q1D6U3_CONCO|nr:hypothetical protein COCON_G00164840 [Conger conger]